MGQLPQDGENGQNVAFFLFFEALQTALAQVLDELEGNQKKENHRHTISKIMGTSVHVQFYTFSYREAVI